MWTMFQLQNCIHQAKSFRSPTRTGVRWPVSIHLLRKEKRIQKGKWTPAVNTHLRLSSRQIHFRVVSQEERVGRHVLGVPGALTPSEWMQNLLESSLFRFILSRGQSPQFCFVHRSRVRGFLVHSQCCFVLRVAAAATTA